MKKILICGEIPPEAHQHLRGCFKVEWAHRGMTPVRFKRALADCHGALVLIDNGITEEVLAAAPQLECISNYGVGFDHIDVLAARRHGVVVTHTPDVLTDATADIAWALVLSCARRLPEGEKLVRRGRFKGWHPMMLLGQDLKGKTLGLYGFGRIGQAVACRAKGWGMKVIYHQRHRVPRAVEVELNAVRVGFDALLRQSDVLSVHAPLTPMTKRRFTRVEFNRMKKTALFVNTSRGGLHDEADLVRALKEGRIFYAGLDVYEKEPRIDPHLRNSSRCVLLPHLGSGTVDTRRRMALMSAGDLKNVLSGRPAIHPVPGGLKRPLRAPALRG